LPDTVRVPLLNDLAPDGFFYGGHYIVEFDPDSLWYETSLTIAALALKKGMKTEYHIFQHPPTEAIEAFSRLGIDAKKMEKEGLLSIWDDYTETLVYETEKEKHTDDAASPKAWVSTNKKPLDVSETYARLPERAKAGYTDQEKRWLHLDDNTAIFLQYNDEEFFVNGWRTSALPYSIRPRECPHFLGFVKGVASDAFYTKFEALCDGIIDVVAKEEGDRIENYIRIRMLRGKVFDSRWHRIVLDSNGEVRLVGTSLQVQQRRLAAIMFTDIVGFTALGQRNESMALETLKLHRELLRPIFSRHGGREVKTIGDAFLVEFGSALEAVLCAIDVQSSVHSLNLERRGRLQVRIGIHIGDIVHQEDDVLGDSVNIASRIEPLAEPGGVCVSEPVYVQVRNKLEYPMASLGAQKLRNVDEPMEVFRLSFPWKAV
jgi:class 3 adenylate cyclase